MDTTNNNNNGSKKILRFRNYRPHDTSLLKTNNQEADNIAEKDNDGERNLNTKNRNEERDVIKRELALYNDEELNIVPKKPNWDLKSTVEERLQKLKRRTQRAIVDMLREKLAQNSDNEDDDA
jgi:coiled-coil domain-containing protein 12